MKQDDQKKSKLAFLGAIKRHFQRTTLIGLHNLIPALVTVAAIAFILGYTDGYVKNLPWVAGKPWDVPGIGMAALLIILYLTGLLLSNRPGRLIMRGFEFIVSRIPVVRMIYGVTQQASDALTSQYGFSRVVFIEWPREGMIAMGFVTGRIQAADHGTIVMVYIPTVPNPTSGNLAFVVEDDVIETDLTVEHAMRLVLSGGTVLPSELALARLPRGDEQLDEYIGKFRRV